MTTTEWPPPSASKEYAAAGEKTGQIGESSGMLRLGTREFGPEDRVIMAIVNRTPDSFFDRGLTFAADGALRAVERAVAEGADIVDIGVITPKAGLALCFRHHLIHEGRAVRSGIKYVLRTDIMYRFDPLTPAAQT